MELKLQLEFELPEVWQLTEELRTLRASKPSQYPENDAPVNEMAQLLWLRLRVVLGYLARTTNRTGRLSAVKLKVSSTRLAAFIHIENECLPEKHRDFVRSQLLALAGEVGSESPSKAPDPLKSQSFRYICVHDAGALTIYHLPPLGPLLFPKRLKPAEILFSPYENDQLGNLIPGLSRYGNMRANGQFRPNHR